MQRAISSDMTRLALFLSVGALACGARSELPIPTSTVSSGGAGGTGGGGAGGAGGGGGAFGVVELALGAEHSCLRTLDGKVYCWGGNDAGQIGQPPSTASSPVPLPVKLGGPARLVAAGTYHSCALLLDGTLWCWGRNADGQIGSGVGSDAYAPVEVSLPAGTTTAVALGEAHSCVLRDEGSTHGAAYCWGRNASGQLGLGAAGSPVGTPQPVIGLFRELALGDFWTIGGNVACPTCATELYGWGDDASFQLGFGSPGPVPLPTPSGVLVHGLRSGKSQHACGLFDGNAEHPLPGVFCWGNNTSAQLGHGYTSDRELPYYVDGLPNGGPQSSPGGGVTEVAPGYDHTCALDAGKVWCWGSNANGKLGNGGVQGIWPSPVQVPGLDGIVALGSGTLHTCAFKSPTEIYCWGGNDFGQLGNGTLAPASTPTLVKLP